MKSKFKFKRHRFDKALISEIQKLHKLDDWHGIMMLLEDWICIAGAIAASLWAWQNLPLSGAALTYLLSVLVIGAKQRGLRVLNHMATHNALAKNPQLNYTLSTIFASWLVLESSSGYDNTHNSLQNGHHPNLGTERDVDHMAIVEQGLYGEGCSPENAEQFLWMIPFKTFGYITFLLKNRVWNPYEKSTERVIRLSYLTVLLSVLLWAGLGMPVLLYWIVPLFTSAIWIGIIIQLAEHYPLMESNHEYDIYVSRNRILNPVGNFFIATHNEGYHLIHHLYPRLPLWQMKKAHQILMADPVYNSLHYQTGMLHLFQQLIPTTKAPVIAELQPVRE
jgi:fatty acid desaturase